MKADRLVSRLELARRLEGAQKTFVYEQCKAGGRLHAAMVGQKVNLSHQNAQIFCIEFKYREPDIVAERKQATAKAEAKAKAAPKYDREPPQHDTIAPDEDEDDEEMVAQDFMGLSLREIVKRYGRQSQFKEYVSAYKTLVQTQAAEEKMGRDRGEYAHWSHLERMAMHIDGLHKMLLSDATKNITDTAMTLTAAGATLPEIRSAITKALEQVIKMAKAQSERIVRNAKS
jgi:hypothetical protein